MVPASVSVLFSVSFVSEPAPEMTPDSVCAADDEYLIDPALAMFPEYKPEFRVPVPETCSVPAETVTAPVNVFAPFNTRVPALLSAGSMSS